MTVIKKSKTLPESNKTKNLEDRSNRILENQGDNEEELRNEPNEYSFAKKFISL